MPIPVVAAAAVDAIVSGKVNAVLKNLGSILGVKGKTPILSYDQMKAVADGVANELYKQLKAAGYEDDIQFRRLIADKQVEFVNWGNPGNAGNRSKTIGQIQANRDGSGAPWATLMYILQGTATDQSSSYNATRRVQDYLERVVTPAVNEYAASKGITAKTITTGSNQTPSSAITSDGGSMQMIGVVALALIAFVVIWKGMK